MDQKASFSLQGMTKEHNNEVRLPNGNARSAKSIPKDYSSDGVTDNDIFMLPASDFQLLSLLTTIAALVRLFRIYQPSSVVFDEVQ